jgi:hypothetical protein
MSPTIAQMRGFVAVSKLGSFSDRGDLHGDRGRDGARASGRGFTSFGSGRVEAFGTSSVAAGLGTEFLASNYCRSEKGADASTGQRRLSCRIGKWMARQTR